MFPKKVGPAIPAAARGRTKISVVGDVDSRGGGKLSEKERALWPQCTAVASSPKNISSPHRTDVEPAGRKIPNNKAPPHAAPVFLHESKASFLRQAVLGEPAMGVPMILAAYFVVNEHIQPQSRRLFSLLGLSVSRRGRT